MIWKALLALPSRQNMMKMIRQEQPDIITIQILQYLLQ